MNIPRLKKTECKQMKKYSDEQIQDVIREFLFQSKSHRQIDQEVLGLEPSQSRGYPTMAVLHHFGLTGKFKGIFAEYSVDEGIIELNQSSNDDYSAIINTLSSVKLGSICAEDIAIESEEEHEVYTDGSKKKYYTTRYERNINNRKKAIELHGTRCMVCGFDFEITYGERGKDYIELHHLKPLSYIGEEVEVNPRIDLAVVCSNCHRMIHRKRNEIVSIEELKEIIAKNKS